MLYNSFFSHSSNYINSSLVFGVLSWSCHFQSMFFGWMRLVSWLFCSRYSNSASPVTQTLKASRRKRAERSTYALKGGEGQVDSKIDLKPTKILDFPRTPPEFHLLFEKSDLSDPRWHDWKGVLFLHYVYIGNGYRKSQWKVKPDFKEFADFGYLNFMRADGSHSRWRILFSPIFFGIFEGW